MQHLDNDMEDLFKRAGENYLPQNGKGDWESVARRISDRSGPVKSSGSLKFKRNKKGIAVYFLLFILLAGIFIIKKSMTETHTAANQNVLSKETNNNAYKKIINSNHLNSDEKDNRSHQFINKKTRNTLRLTTPASNRNVSSATLLFNDAFSNTKIDNQGIHSDKWKKDAVIEKLNNKEIFFSPWSNPGNSPGKLLKAERYYPDIEPHDNLSTLLQKKAVDILLVKKEKQVTSTIQEKKKGLYVGVIAASDFSKVRSRSFHQAGFDAGLLAGFRINKKWSIEAGISWNKKVYISEGKNFDMGKVRSTMPAAMIINTLDGQSFLMEFPLKVKYHILQKKRSDFFIAAGTSSYIVTKEKNMYDATLNGTNEKISGIYQKNSYGIPAVVSISSGYEARFSGNVNIRIEPFLKVPVRGIGVGRLPVTSAGLQVGFFNRLK